MSAETLRNLVSLTIGGAAGTVCRYAITMLALRTFGPGFAIGTLAVNVTGCFALGVLLALFGASAASSRAVQLGLTTGFLGGFTTFSTFGYETLHYWETGKPELAVANVLANVVLALLATWGGLAITRLLV